MIEKTLFKIDSGGLNTLYSDPEHEEVLKQEVYSIQENMIVVRKILDSGVAFNEIVFEKQDLKEVILSNVDIQFALFQFYMIYQGELQAGTNQPKYVGELHYPELEGQLNEKLVMKLLTLFDSLRVAYKNGKVHIQITLSNPDSMKKVYDGYHTLYTEGRLNPFILFFLSRVKGQALIHTPYVTYQYRPNTSEICDLEVTQQEMKFIEFVQLQLALAPYFICYCVGWGEEEVMDSTEMKKLAKYFPNVFFLSTTDVFLSQMLIISK
ncbi:hypothetical protein [Paenibacillus sp. FSL R5-0519]|uniref:hypothetical protein n=1 Tax=Paenibacillus sp. FSL R5-0519 TaxID=2921648 RepID=UPI0030DAF484